MQFNLSQKWHSLLQWLSRKSVYKNSRLIRQAEQHLHHCLVRIPDTQLLRRLYDESLWDHLLEQSHNSQHVHALRAEWNHLKSMAHLDSKTLLALLSNEILSLEYAYPTALTSDISFEERSKYAQKMTHLSSVKDKLLSGLKFRACLYQKLSTRSEVDDVLGYFCHQINALNVLTEPLDLSRQWSCSLNHERRIAIRDWTLSTHISADSPLTDMLLKPISSPAVPPTASSNLINALTQSHLEFMKAQSGFWISSDLLHAIRNFPGIKQALLASQWTVKWCFNQLNVRYVGFHSWHYYLMVLLSISCFLMLSQFLTSQILAAAYPWLSKTVFTLLESGLSYSLGLLPLWILTGYSGLSILTHFYHWKLESIQTHSFDALLAIRVLETKLSNFLMRSITDIKRSDIKEYTQILEEGFSQIQQFQSLLQSLSWLDRACASSKLRKHIASLVDRLDLLQKAYHEASKRLSLSFADRVGAHIEHLVAHHANYKLEPYLSASQLHTIQNFVKRYGDSTSKSLLKFHLNIPFKCCQQLASLRIEIPASASNTLTQLPWGRSMPHHAAINGWERLLRHYPELNRSTQACLALLNLLRGEQVIDQSYLDAVLADLSQGALRDKMHAVVQQHLFECLTIHNTHFVPLLSDEHRQIISDYYALNQDKIVRAHVKLSHHFKMTQSQDSAEHQKPLSKKDCHKLSQLCDISDIFHALSVDPITRTTVSSLKKHLSQYEGHSNHVHFMLNQLPAHDVSILLQRLTLVRLNTLLRSSLVQDMRCFELSPDDIDLFFQYQVELSEEYGSLAEIIQNHVCFSELPSEVLEVFHQHGFYQPPPVNPNSKNIDVLVHSHTVIFRQQHMQETATVAPIAQQHLPEQVRYAR